MRLLARRCMAWVMPSRKNALPRSLPPWRYGVATNSSAFGTANVAKSVGEDRLAMIAAAKHKRSLTDRRSRCCRSMEDRLK